MKQITLALLAYSSITVAMQLPQENKDQTTEAITTFSKYYAPKKTDTIWEVFHKLDDGLSYLKTLPKELQTKDFAAKLQPTLDAYNELFQDVDPHQIQSALTEQEKCVEAVHCFLKFMEQNFAALQK